MLFAVKPSLVEQVTAGSGTQYVRNEEIEPLKYALLIE